MLCKFYGRSCNELSSLNLTDHIQHIKLIVIMGNIYGLSPFDMLSRLVDVAVIYKKRMLSV